jgi:hypothetical protein
MELILTPPIGFQLQCATSPLAAPSANSMLDEGTTTNARATCIGEEEASLLAKLRVRAATAAGRARALNIVW